MDLTAIDIQTIQDNWLINNKISLDVLRLDKIDPVVSGNKWFKLKYYICEAIDANKETIATFGGAWSNNIVAAACACRKAGLRSVGIIRGERPPKLSATLMTAQQYGMELHFVSRDAYRNSGDLYAQFAAAGWFILPEGGYGVPGAKGASEILHTTDTTSYTHIVAAVGTGTMLAGLLLGALPHQQITGISSMKGNQELEQQVVQLTGHAEHRQQFKIFHDYHFGGYGKHPPALLQFINEVYKIHQLPLDIVYTGKTFFAIRDLAEKSFFEAGSKLLMIHSGGLLGNASLPAEVLAF